jgi:hypothetical protein
MDIIECIMNRAAKPVEKKINKKIGETLRYRVITSPTIDVKSVRSHEEAITILEEMERLFEQRLEKLVNEELSNGRRMTHATVDWAPQTSGGGRLRGVITFIDPL